MHQIFSPLDNNGIPFEFPSAAIGWMEQEKIRHEINTNYSKYHGYYCIHDSYGLNGQAYHYYFENKGFDNINIYARFKNYF